MIIILYLIASLISIIIYFVVVLPIMKLLLLKIKHGNEIYIIYYPILGIQNWQRENTKKYGEPYYLLKQELKKNPKIKVVAWNLGFNIVFSSIDPETTKSFLVENYEKSVKVSSLFNYNSLKNGILFSEGEQWKKQRKMMSDSFHFDSLKSRFGVISQVTKQTIQSLKQYEGKEQFPLFDEMMKLSGEIGIRVFFGPDFGEHEIDGKPISLELAEIVDQTINYSYTSIFFQLKRAIFGQDLAMKLLSLKEKKLLQKTDRVFNLVLKQIEKKIEQYNENSNKQSDYLIDILVKNFLTKQDSSLTKEQIQQQCITMFIAALDNTGCFIAWTIYCIANYKEEAKLVYQEIDSIFPSQEKLDNIQFEDLKNLDYTSAFIDECFRMYSSSPGILIRQVTQPFKAGKFNLTKSDFIHTIQQAAFFNPDLFENPDKFDVSRFLNGKEKQLNTYAFIPFSVGPRNCIGKYMSLIEIKITMIYFIKMFSVSRNETVPLTTTQTLIYRPIDQNLVKIALRI